jgi:hypothetical protein
MIAAMTALPTAVLPSAAKPMQVIYLTSEIYILNANTTPADNPGKILATSST